MSFKDVAAILSAWLLGIFTQIHTNDSAARVLCRTDLLELGNILEKLALQQNNPSRSLKSDAIKIEEIKQTLRRLDVNKAGLFIEPPALKNIVEQSLEYILSCKKNPGDPSAYIPFEGVELRNKWGCGMGRDYEAKKINEIRLFLDANIFARIYMRFCQCNSEKGKMMIIIIKRYMRGFAGATVLLIISWFFAYYLKKILSDHNISTILYLFEPIAIILIATTLYGGLGWEIQTWGGEAREEKANRLIFNILLSLSYFLTATVLFLK